MHSNELKERMMAFGVRVIKLVDALPQSQASWVIGRQMLKSGTSIGANYREALHASSPRHFITVMELAQREASETAYWIELIINAGLLPAEKVEPLLDESRQLYAILTKTILTRKHNLTQQQDTANQ